MKLPQTGRCQCGAVAYALEAEPVTVYACHCHQCQHQSASAFGISAIVPRDALRFTEGTPAEWHRTTPSGRAQICYYCADCGSRILHWHVDAAVGALKPGTLDDASWVQPVAHIFTESAQPWTAPLRATLPDFPGAPDMAALSRLSATAPPQS